LLGLTTPLITNASGAKMGKTAQGAVWLNAEKLSPYQYWQFWRNTDDADVGRFLRLFTELDLTEIEQLGQGDINEAKKVLATEATALCHGREGADVAAETARAVFGQPAGSDKGAPANLRILRDGIEMAPAGSLPQVPISRELVEQGLPAFELFMLAGLASSNSEARRLIRGGGARINDAIVTNESQMVSAVNDSQNGFIKLSKGRKTHVLVKLH
jgi:tyrosyl-tRNA synthetase